MEYRRKILNHLRSKLIFVLLIVAVLMTSSTFAYWTEYVEGAEIKKASFITIGEYQKPNSLFLLSSEYAIGEYQVINNAYFTNNPGSTHSFEESFMVEWLSDSSWVDYFIIEGNIEFDYTVLLLNENGSNVSSRKYDRLIPYISVVFNEDNPSKITLNEEPTSYEFMLEVQEPTKDSHYNQLKDLTIALQISYRVNGITYQYIYK